MSAVVCTCGTCRYLICYMTLVQESNTRTKHFLGLICISRYSLPCFLKCYLVKSLVVLYFSPRFGSIEHCGLISDKHRCSYERMAPLFEGRVELTDTPILTRRCYFLDFGDMILTVSHKRDSEFNKSQAISKCLSAFVDCLHSTLCRECPGSSRRCSKANDVHGQSIL